MRKIIRKIQVLSIFDSIVILVAIFSVVIFAYIFFRKTSYIIATVKVGSNHILWTGGSSHAWLDHYLHEGMKQKGAFGKTNVEVLKVRSYDLGPDRSTSYLTLKLNAVYNRATNQYTFQGKPIAIGSPIRLYLDQLLAEGMITHVEGVPDTRKKMTLVVETQLREETNIFSETIFPKTSGVRAHIAEAVAEGQEIKDSQGQTVIKILKKEVKNAQKIVTTSDGRVILQSDPLLKDVYLTLQIETTQINGRNYVFDDVSVLVGYPIPISTSTFSISPEVTKFLSSH